MEKYGTPQCKEEEKDEGIYKISAKQMKACCLTALKFAKVGAEVKCSCGNEIAVEKLSE